MARYRSISELNSKEASLKSNEGQLIEQSEKIVSDHSSVREARDSVNQESELPDDIKSSVISDLGSGMDEVKGRHESIESEAEQINQERNEMIESANAIEEASKSKSGELGSLSLNSGEVSGVRSSIEKLDNLSQEAQQESQKVQQSMEELIRKLEANKSEMQG